MQQRGHPGGQRGGNRGRPSNRGKRESPLKFEGDFDFETSNAQFDKEEIEKELKKLTIGKFNQNIVYVEQKITFCLKQEIVICNLMS